MKLKKKKMAKKREKIKQDGYEFDSWEEVHFWWWCQALMKAGYIREFHVEPESFVLTDPIVVDYLKPMKKVADKMVPEEIMKGNLYTCDALIKWTEKANGIFFLPIDSTRRKKKAASLQYMIAHHDEYTGWHSYVEVKPIFDQNNMTRLAVNNIKHVYSKFGSFINLAIPPKLFNKSFTPARFLYCDKDLKRKRKVKHKNVISLKSFIDNSSLDS